MRRHLQIEPVDESQGRYRKCPLVVLCISTRYLNTFDQNGLGARTRIFGLKMRSAECGSDVITLQVVIAQNGMSGSGSIVVFAVGSS